jgi:hypothetical protein
MNSAKKRKPDMTALMLTEQEVQALYFTLESALDRHGTVDGEHQMLIRRILDCIESEVSQ